MVSWHKLDEADSRESEVVGDCHTRARDLLLALSTATGTLDIKVGYGEMGNPDSKYVPAVVLDLNGQVFAFTIPETDWLSSIIMDGIHNFPKDKWVDTLTDIIIMMRYATQEATIEHGGGPSGSSN